MAITVGNSTSIEAGATSLTTLSGSHTVAAGSDRILVITIPESRNITISAVTYGGVALTLANSLDVSSNEAYIYYLVNPTVGTYTASVTYSAANAFYLFGVVNLYGVDQTTPIGGTNTVSSSVQNKTISVTTVRDGSYLFECLADGGITNTPASGQTLITGNANRIGAYSTTTTAGSYTRNWTGNSAGAYVHIIAEVKASISSATNSNFFQFF